MVELEYYDKLLLAIAGSLAAGTAIGLFTAVSLSTGVAGGAIVATIFVYDAMFRSSPVSPTDPETVAAAIVWHAFVIAVVLGWAY